MRRQVKAVLGVLVAAGIFAAFAATATAQTTGTESLTGTIIATANASGDRTVRATVIRARGVFNGVGRIVEIPNQPGDPDNVLRDDLVFADGVMHLVTTVTQASATLNPESCVLIAMVQQTAVVTGGTGRFDGASGSFAGELEARVVLPRNPDHSCSDVATTNEIDQLASNGTLTF